MFPSWKSQVCQLLPVSPLCWGALTFIVILFLKNQTNFLQLCMLESCVVSCACLCHVWSARGLSDLLSTEMDTATSCAVSKVFMRTSSGYSSDAAWSKLISTFRRTTVAKYCSNGSALTDWKQHRVHMLCALPCNAASCNAASRKDPRPLANRSIVGSKVGCWRHQQQYPAGRPCRGDQLLYPVHKESNTVWWFLLRFLLCHKSIMCCQACST